MSFAASIKAFEEKALLKANKNVSIAFQYLGTQSVDLTANGKINIGGHSNGDIANNWHWSVGAPNIVIPNGPDITGSASLARIQSFATSMAFYRQDNIVYLNNVMNYAYRADKVGWPMGRGTNGWFWSGRVPVGYGFVGQAVNNLKGKYS